MGEGPRKWDCRLKPGNKVILQGASGSGKSHYMRNIIWANRNDYDIIILVSKTEKFDPGFGDLVPNLFVHIDLDVDLIRRFIERQKMAMRMEKDPAIMFVFDDCGHKKKEVNSEWMKEIFILGRHLDMTVLIALQYVYMMEPTQRQNLDVLLMVGSLADPDQIHSAYFKEISMDLFLDLYNDITDNRNAFILLGGAGRVLDRVRWYGAPALPYAPPGMCYWHYFPVAYRLHLEHYMVKLENSGKAKFQLLDEQGIFSVRH